MNMMMNKKLAHYVHILKEVVKGRNAVSLTKPHLGGYRIGGDYATHIPPLFEKMLQLGCKSCLDVGCGEGHAIDLMLKLGFSEVKGIEGLPRAIKNSPVPELIEIHDLTKSIFIAEDKFDLVYCSEVAEHISEEYEGNLLVTLACNAKNYIVLTAAEPGQSGFHHVNCKPRSYWINIFTRLGFYYDKSLTEEVANDIKRSCTGYRHFTKNGIIFVRK